jgi:class 3 adenylate cyclase
MRRAVVLRCIDEMPELQAVHRYEGTVNLVMGDGIMALFGAPVAHEDHAVRACYAAPPSAFRWGRTSKDAPAGEPWILLREVVPALRRLAILANAGNPVTPLDMREVEAAACRSALQ